MITPVGWRSGLWICGVLMFASGASGGAALEAETSGLRREAGALTDSPIVVRSLEFPGGLPVMLRSAGGAQSGMIPTAEAENLCRLMALDRAVYVGKPELHRLRVDGSSHVVGALDPFLGKSEDYKKGGSTVLINGRPFTTRNVGVEAALVLQDSDAEQVRMNATLQTTVFKGFGEYGGVQVQIRARSGKESDNRTVTVPKGFYQPIFETQSREEKLTLKRGQTTWVLVVLPQSEPALGPFWVSIDHALSAAFIPKGSLYREGTPRRGVLFLFRMESVGAE